MQHSMTTAGAHRCLHSLFDCHFTMGWEARQYDQKRRWQSRRRLSSHPINRRGHLCNHCHILKQRLGRVSHMAYICCRYPGLREAVGSVQMPPSCLYKSTLDENCQPRTLIHSFSLYRHIGLLCRIQTITVGKISFVGGDDIHP